jgi:hypothetical protein
MSKLTAAEQDQVDAHLREHGARRCPHARAYASLPMAPTKGRGAPQVRANRQALDDLGSLPDPGVLPA